MRLNPHNISIGPDELVPNIGDRYYIYHILMALYVVFCAFLSSTLLPFLHGFSVCVNRLINARSMYCHRIIDLVI